MTYCQDCGAANELANPSCRICGRTLTVERGLAACPSCEELVGEGAAFCWACGASCAGALDPLLGERHRRVREPVAAAVGSEDSLGAGLELPAWLLRAAAETPPDPTASVQPALDREFVIRSRRDRVEPVTRSPIAASSDPRSNVAWAEPVTGGANERPPGQSKGGTPRSEPAPALRPLPDGGLSRTMPDWLRGAAPDDTGPKVSGQMAEAASVSPPEPEQPATAALDDPTDTSNFISEDDLPDWLRNLAAAEAAQAEEARRAASEHAAEPDAASGGGRATRPPAADNMLDQTSAPSAPAGAWLSRRTPRALDDATRSARHGGHGSAFAEVVGAKPEPPPVTPQPIGAAPSGEEVAVPARSGGRSRQWYVRVAILVLAVVVLILLVINAGIVG